MIESLFLLASVAQLNCAVEPPQMVQLEGGKASASQVGLPPEMNRWKFGVAVGEGQPAPITLDWPGDPIRAGKPTKAFQIGPKDYSFISVHSGPCLFTNTGCVFMYTLSIHKDGSADILVQPSAIMGGANDERRAPFQVFMTGRCTPAGAAK